MSTAKLTLRPPPNVEFVQGYPGIPPGPDRTQAAVKGSIELRVGPQGIKARWVRIELRKVETLPGGGQTSTFFDFVGQSPVNVWQTSDEYGVLHTQDFPFYIRIPESIPPSLALEKGAGVKYELVAQLCIKSKSGFFRRDKSTIVSTMSPIVIDKHELHSTWPLYQQPESRHLAQEGVTLTIDRHNTCYGPGDRVSVMATLKCDSQQTVILRGFEFTLRESIVFRAGANATGKKAAPLVKVGIVGDQKVPVNATLYAGQQHRAELACVLPQHHTTTTLTSARHIDITYVIGVKALMGTGKPLVMDLPVIISNWPRAVSIEAVRRIGPTTSLSLTNSASAQPIVHTQQPLHGATIADRGSQRPDIPDPGRQFSTMPATAARNGYGSGVDEFGRPIASDDASLSTYGGMISSPVSSRGPMIASPPPPDGGIGLPRRSEHHANGDVHAATVGASRAPRTQNRFSVVNYDESDLPSSADSLLRRPSALTTPTTPASSQWLTAEEEKRRLYEQAMAKVERVQTGAIAASHSPPPTMSQPQMQIQPSRRAASPPMQEPRRTAWLTAEEEKTRLYNQAQALAQQTQSFAAGMHERTASDASSQRAGGSGAAGGSAALYAPAVAVQQQMSPPGRNASLSRVGGSGTGSGSGSGPAQAQNHNVRMPQPQYPSADQEKAMLQRYHHAKAAVDRVQTDAFGVPIQTDGYGSSSQPEYVSPTQPIAYDSLFPGAQAEAGPPPPPPAPPAAEMPPAFDGTGPTNAFTEKELLRRHWATQDAAAQPPPPQAPPPNVNGANGYPNSTSPAPYYPPPGSSNGHGYEREAPYQNHNQSANVNSNYGLGADDGRHGYGYASPPPQHQHQQQLQHVDTAFRAASPPGAPRSPPVPPSATTYVPLTAAEEKARLRAQYESEDQPPAPPPQVPGYRAASPPTIPYAPPLMPRPPPDYIRQTDGASPPPAEYGQPHRTYTPFRGDYDGGVNGNGNGNYGPPGSRPPIPPKVPQ